ncbi:uncharacterized protein [Centruroides vittatus]|uniref:uncharacterized protein n=1 Tax=Centruroides vittatus TaxID=120091 RepID=UPI00350EA9BD
MSEPVVGHVAVKPPSFWSKNPALWFAQLESQFVLANISHNETKYSHVVASLSERMTTKVQDILATPPNTDKYKAIKRALIDRMSQSEAQRLEKLLRTEELGDRTPSQFLRRLRTLAGHTVTEDLLRRIWLSRFPTDIQKILTVSEGTLESLTKIADRLSKLYPSTSNISATSTASATVDPRIAALEVQISEMSQQYGRSPPHRCSSSRGRLGRRSPPNTFSNNVCCVVRTYPEPHSSKRLIDSTTKLVSQGHILSVTSPSVRTIAGNSSYHRLLSEFPEIARPSPTIAPVRHSTVHHIITTPGQPVCCKPRRLAPDKYILAKRAFEFMLAQRICRPSTSSWSSPLHLVPKKNDQWRPCGDYRLLNARTVPDRYPVPHIEDFASTLHGSLITSELNELLQGNPSPKDHLEWTSDADSAFRNVKNAVASAALLAHPSRNTHLSLIVDASSTAVGASLQQRIDGHWQPLAFFSQKLS